MLEIAENGRTWVLSGPTSSYAVHLTEQDELLHLHWGPAIALADAEELAARPLPGASSFESRLDGREEYPVEGGPASPAPPSPCARPSAAAQSGPSSGTTPRATNCGSASGTAASRSRCTTGRAATS